MTKGVNKLLYNKHNPRIDKIKMKERLNRIILKWCFLMVITGLVIIIAGVYKSGSTYQGWSMLWTGIIFISIGNLLGKIHDKITTEAY